jgi:hypothetical protein
MHMFSALFAPSGNESKVREKMSRFIRAKNLTISPFRCPLNGSLFGSSPKQRMILRAPICSSGEVEHGANDPTSNLPVEGMVLREQSNGSKLPTKPSAAAKALLDRIPDLSYMLSPEFSPPAGTVLSTT